MTAFSNRAVRYWLCSVIIAGLVILFPLLEKSRSLEVKTQTAAATQLSLSTPAAPSTFNFALNSVSPSIFPFTYEGLTRENGVSGAIEPALAESWERSPDGKQYRFTLRAGLKWSDGQPLTAEDVVFTYRDVLFNPEIPTDIRDFFQVGAIKALPKIHKLDNLRVEFTLEPFTPFLRITTGTAILPKHALAETLRSRDAAGNLAFLSTWGIDTDPAKVVVNGPYRMESFTAEEVIFRRNPYYWRKDAAGNSLPYIDRIHWKVIQNRETALQQFLEGKLDVIGDGSPLRSTEIAQLKSQETHGKLQIYDGGPRSNTLFLTFNLNRAQKQDGKPLVAPVKSRWFNTLEFRQAVAYAIDRDTINQNLFGGLGSLQHSSIPAQSPYFLQNGLKLYEHNPEKARELLKRAGFRYNTQNQLLDNRGNLVQFTLLTNSENQTRVAIGKRIQQDLANIGIQVNLTLLSFNAFIDKTSFQDDWDALLIGFTGGIEPNDSANIWMSDGNLHLFNLKSPFGKSLLPGWQATPVEQEIDRLFLTAAGEMDENKRKQIYARFQQLVQEQVPVIYLVGDRALMAAYKRVQGIQYSGLSDWGLWNIGELKLKDEG